MTDAEIEAYSYTAAAGKRPFEYDEDDEADRFFIEGAAWFFGDGDENYLPIPIYQRLQGGQPYVNGWWSFGDEAAALAAADEAWRRARRDGAIGAEGGGA